MSQSVAVPSMSPIAAEIEIANCQAVGCNAGLVATPRDAKDGVADADGAATPSSVPMTPHDRTEVAMVAASCGDASGSSSPTGATTEVPPRNASQCDADAAPPQQNSAPAQSLEAGVQPEPQPQPQPSPAEGAAPLPTIAEAALPLPQSQPGEQEPETVKVPEAGPAPAGEHVDDEAGSKCEVGKASASPSRKRSREAEDDAKATSPRGAVAVPMPATAEEGLEASVGAPDQQPAGPTETASDADMPAPALQPEPEVAEPLPQEVAAGCEAHESE